MNEQQEFVRLTEECRQELLGYILLFVPDRNDALDVLQETVLALWTKFGEYDPQRPFLAWARKFAHVQSLRHRTTQRRSNERLVLLSDAALAQVAAEYDRHEDVLLAMHDALQECLQKLKPEDYDMLRKRYWEAGSLRQLAAESGKKESLLYNRLHRIRGRLLACIESTMARES